MEKKGLKMTGVRHSYRQGAKSVVTGNIYIKVRCSLGREVSMNDSAKGLAQSSGRTQLSIPVHPSQSLLVASKQPWVLSASTAKMSGL